MLGAVCNSSNKVQSTRRSAAVDRILVQFAAIFAGHYHACCWVVWWTSLPTTHDILVCTTLCRMRHAFGVAMFLFNHRHVRVCGTFRALAHIGGTVSQHQILSRSTVRLIVADIFCVDLTLGVRVHRARFTHVVRRLRWRARHVRSCRTTFAGKLARLLVIFVLIFPF